MKTAKPRVKIFFPLDVPNLSQADKILKEVGNYIDVVKIGLEIIYNCGLSKTISLIKKYNLPIMVDAKLIDIAPTVAGGLAGIIKYEIDYVTLMAVGGRPMIETAVEKINETFEKKAKRPQIVVVTILTSLKFWDLVELGIIPDKNFLKIIGIKTPANWQLPNNKKQQQKIINQIVLRWARIAIRSGADIILSSPLELPILASEFPNVGLISAGIRPSWSLPDHQKRKLSPYEAIKKGAKNLVIGRPIRQPPNGMTPQQAAQKIRAEINLALRE